MSVAIYALKASTEDYARMEQAITLAAQCPPSKGAYSVGAVIVTEDGQVFTGYSRETAPTNHAEEEAILKAIRAGSRLTGATVYSSMEPCTTRKSKPASCSELIILHRMKRVVFAAYEPPTFVTCLGETVLRQAGDRVYHQRPCTKSTGCQPAPREITDNTCMRFNFLSEFFANK